MVERGRQRTPVRPAEGVALAEPLVVHIESDPAPQGFIQIIDIRDGNRVITVIEFLSPSYKLPGDGQRQYLRKQKECREAGVNLVEVDLVREGERVTIAHQFMPRRSDTTYQVCVYRGGEPDKCDVYPIRLQDRLPGIRIPLRKDDPDVALDLQALIDQVYRNAAYGDDIDYAQPCRPPLTGEDAAWADELLRAAGKR